MSLTPEQEEKIQGAVYEAGLRAKAEGQMVASQAQRLFYEYWNSGGHDAPLKEGIDHFKKCMNMADEMRKVVTDDFSQRVSEFDKEMRDKYKDSKIILPSAAEWESWRPPGV